MARRILPGSDQILLMDDGEVRIGNAANYTAIEPDGFVELNGNARAWKSVQLTPHVNTVPAADAPDNDTYQGFDFDRYDRASEEAVYDMWHIPADFAQGTQSIRGHFTLFVENPPSGTGDEVVVMGFEYWKFSDGDVFDTSGAADGGGTLSETIVDGEAAYKIHETDTGYVTTTGWAPGDIIAFRFYRDATNVADTYDNEAVGTANDVWVGIYHLEYLVDRMGEAS